jgi:hypothetical protein
MKAYPSVRPAPPRRGAQSLTTIFAVPMAIGVISCIGLISALTGDGLRDMVSWVALVIPIGAIIWAMRTRRC